MSGIDWGKLPEVLAEHKVSYGDWKECSCGYPNPGLAHLAAVVREWVEGQMVEEWGIRYERTADPTMDNPSGEITATMVLRDEAHARQAMDSPALLSSRNKRAVRRLVTEWGEGP